MAANRFGAWLAARRVPRVAFIAGFFQLGLFGVFSTAVVMLAAIARGWRVAVTDCLVAGVLLVGFALAAGGPWQLFAWSAGTFWPLAIGLGSLTGQFGTLTLPLQALLVLAAVLVLIFSITVGDTTAYWIGALQAMAAEFEAAGVELGSPDVLAMWAPMMTGLMASLAVISVVLALLLGSWWAAGAGGPSLGPMFRKLRFGNVIGGAAALAGIASIAGGGQLANDLLLVLATGFVLQGLAVVHWYAKVKQWPSPLLLAVYLPMLPILVGPVVAATMWFGVAAVGFVDNWFPLRRGNSNVV